MTLPFEWRGIFDSDGIRSSGDGVHNVRALAYGALGNGVADDRAAFAACDAAAGTGERLIPAGLYRIASNFTFTGPMRVLPGAIIKPDSGVTVTFNSPVSAVVRQCVDLSAGGKAQFIPGAVRQIYPEWFGADPTNTNDSTAALQAAIDTAIASNVILGAHVTVVLSGRYKTTKALRGFSWAAGVFTFCTFHIEGARGYISGKQVEICPTFTDQPALILQAVRAVNITGVTFTGALTQVFPTYLQCLADTGGSAGTPWYNSGNAGRDAKYSPYCAVSVDPFSNGVPSDGGIPGHNGVAGSTNYYTQNIGSSVVTIDGCCARQFIVAWALSLSPNSQQCDSVTFRDCTEENIKVAFALGQTQTRNINIFNTHALYARVMFDCVSYGNGGGEFPNVVGGLVSGACKWLMIATGGFGSGSIKQFYAESIWSLGQWGGGYEFTFDDCHFAMIPPGNGGNASSHFDCANGAGGPVIFRGGSFGFFNNVYGRLSICAAGVIFDGCVLNGEPLVPRFATVEFRRAYLRFSGQGTLYGIAHEFRELFASFNSTAEAILAPCAVVHESLSSTEYRRFRWREYQQDITIDGAAAITVNGDGTATFTSAGGAPKLRVGDYLTNAIPVSAWALEKFVSTMATVTPTGISLGSVQSIVGNVVTLQDVPNGMGSGTYFLQLHRLPRYKPRTVGITTSGSNSITNVSPIGMWRVNDRIQSGNLPSGTYITAVNAGTNTLTVSQNATVTGTAELYDVKMTLEKATRDAVPTADSWFQGDFVENNLGTPDANNMVLLGWRCTVSGRADGVSPAATFKTIYGSAVTPAT